MTDWLQARAAVSPERVFLIEHIAPEHTHAVTFAQMDAQVTRMVAQMQAAGIERGQHVAMLMMSSALAVVPFFAAMRLGVVFVPLNTRLTTAELDFQLRQADVDWLLPYGTSDMLRELRDCGHRIANLDKPTTPSTSQSRDIDLREPCLIVHTSGTSGQPKGATLTYGNLYHSAMASAYRIGHLPDDKWLCVLPLYHVGGLSILVRAVLYGIAVDLRERFDVDEINRALTHERITLASLVPTMLYRLLETRTTAWDSALRLILVGGAATSPQLMARCIAENIPVATTYGLSEAASQVATTLPGDAARKPGTVGKPLLFTQIRIVDEYGDDLPQGEYGEIIVKSPTVMRGYYNNPEATARTLRDGWLHTGDIGYLDNDGDLFLVQRRSDLIVSGGENVYPAEVENVLRDHPAVREAVVVGLDDPEWGQRVAAAIMLHNGRTVSTDDLTQHARQYLAGYKIPRRMIFVDELPMTGSGKIQRAAVKGLFDD